VSPTQSEEPVRPAEPARRDRYHHGDLRSALVDTAVDLIAERGVRGFSLAEASRRLGVTVAAPYRHFADRDDLLAAVAIRAFGVFAAVLAATLEEDATPAEQLAVMAGAYVRFAAQHRPLFDVLFGAGIDKSRYPDLRSAAEPVKEMFLAPVRVLCDDAPEAVDDLVTAVSATAHGYAALLLDGAFGAGDSAIDTAVPRATRATLALVAGRRALRQPEASGLAGTSEPAGCRPRVERWGDDGLPEGEPGQLE
jgi:AcrR family transcriptional regulator